MLNWSHHPPSCGTFQKTSNHLRNERMMSVANQLLSHASSYFRRDPLGQAAKRGGPSCYQAQPKQSLSRSGFMSEWKHRRVETRWSHAPRHLSLGTVSLLLTHPGAGKVCDGAKRPGWSLTCKTRPKLWKASSQRRLTHRPCPIF